METEIEKAKEAIKWLDMFDAMRASAYYYSINETTFNSLLKQQIQKYRDKCEDILTTENKEL